MRLCGRGILVDSLLLKTIGFSGISYCRMTKCNLHPIFVTLAQNNLQNNLPDRSSLNYCLRPRRHNKTLITKTSELDERDFIIRNIYKDIY